MEGKKKKRRGGSSELFCDIIKSKLSYGMSLQASICNQSMAMAVSVQAHTGAFDYHPTRVIDGTEYKWNFEDIKPLTDSTSPLKFCMADRPFLFCPAKVELHLKEKFKVGNRAAPTYPSAGDKDGSTLVVGPVKNFSYICIRQIRCRVNNNETELAGGVNLAYREYFKTLLEADPWEEKGYLERQGWYRDVPGQIDKWGAKEKDNALYNAARLRRQKACVNNTGTYEFNVRPLPCNFCQVEQNVPPNTKVELDVEFNDPRFCLMAISYKADGRGAPATSGNNVSFDVMARESFLRIFYRVPNESVTKEMEAQVGNGTVAKHLTFPFRRMRCVNYQLSSGTTT